MGGRREYPATVSTSCSCVCVQRAGTGDGTHLDRAIASRCEDEIKAAFAQI